MIRGRTGTRQARGPPIARIRSLTGSRGQRISPEQSFPSLGPDAKPPAVRSGHPRDVFGACLIRLESQGEFAPTVRARDSQPTATEPNAAWAESRMPATVAEDCETQVLEAIRQEARELSADCCAADGQCTPPAAVSADSATVVAPSRLDAEFELLDLEPASIDEYMNRVLARSRQAAVKRERNYSDSGLAPPAFPVPAATQTDALAQEASESLAEVPETLPEVSLDTERTEPMLEAIAEPARPATEHAAARRPRGARNPGDTRANRDNLREIVIESTRSTLVQHIRRRHRTVVFRKLLLIFVALGLASILYAAHFTFGVAIKHLAWGATAIGFVALLGMVQLWSRSARQQARLHARVSYARRRTAEAGTKGTRLGRPAPRSRAP